MQNGKEQEDKEELERRGCPDFDLGDFEVLWFTQVRGCRERYGKLGDIKDQEDWNMIASFIPGVTADSCMFKWLSLRKTNLAANSWN